MVKLAELDGDKLIDLKKLSDIDDNVVKEVCIRLSSKILKIKYLVLLT